MSQIIFIDIILVYKFYLLHFLHTTFSTYSQGSSMLKILAYPLQNLSISDKMFRGNYGSQLENRLEEDLDTLEAHRGRILEANFKWRQGQMMLEYACKQLAVAVQKWQDLPTLPTMLVSVIELFIPFYRKFISFTNPTYTMLVSVIKFSLRFDHAEKRW